MIKKSLFALTLLIIVFCYAMLPTIQDFQQQKLREKEHHIWYSSNTARKELPQQPISALDKDSATYLEINRELLLRCNVGDILTLYIPLTGQYSNAQLSEVSRYQDLLLLEAYDTKNPETDRLRLFINSYAIYGTLSQNNMHYIIHGNGQYAWIKPDYNLTIPY